MEIDRKRGERRKIEREVRKKDISGSPIILGKLNNCTTVVQVHKLNFLFYLLCILTN